MSVRRVGYACDLTILFFGLAAAQPPAPSERPPPRPAFLLGSPGFRHGAWITEARFTADGRGVVTLGYDHAIRLWDRQTGGERYRFPAESAAWAWQTFDLSADGRLLAGYSSLYLKGPGRARTLKKKLHLFEVTTGREIRSWDMTASPWSLTFSPDGQLLLFAGGPRDGLGGWTVATGEPLPAWPWPDSANPPGSVCFLPDGRRLVTAGDGGVIRVWDVATRQILRSWSAEVVAPKKLPGEYPPCVVAAALSPDGALLAASGNDGSVKLWDVNQGRFVRALEGPLKNVTSLAFSPDGATLYGGGSLHRWGVSGKARNTPVVAWDVASGRLRRELPTGMGRREALAVAPDGHALALAGAGETVVTLVEPTTGLPMTPFVGHRGHVLAERFSPGGRLLATASQDGRICLWDTGTWRQVRTLDRHTWEVRGLAFSADGRLLASGGGDRTARVWDVASGQLTLAIPTLGSGRIADLCFTDRDRQLVVAGDDGLTCWDAGNGGLRERFPGVNGNDLRAFSPDGRTVWCQGFHLRLPARDRQLPGGSPAVVVTAFAPDGWSLLEVGDDGTARLIDRLTGQVRRAWSVRVEADVLPQDREPGAKAFYLTALTPDGRWAVTGRPRYADSPQATTLRFWSARTGRQVNEFSAPSELRTLTFSPDGRWLVSGHADGRLRVWDTATILSSTQAPEPAPPLDQAWRDLTSEEAATAHAALAAIVDRGPAAAAWLAAKVQPPTIPEAAQVRGWIADLASPQFATREAAQRRLEEVTEAAQPLVRQALAGELTPEARRRLETLAERPGRLVDAESRRTLRALEALERLRAPQLGPVLQRLAAGPAGHRVTEEAAAALFRWQGARGEAASGGR